jgi:hypothetical protein
MIHRGRETPVAMQASKGLGENPNDDSHLSKLGVGRKVDHAV